MNIQDLKSAIDQSRSIVSKFTAGVETDEAVISARNEELSKLSKTDLISRILELEAPKAESTVKVEEVARAILTDPACALLNYEQVAAVIVSGLNSKTSSKSIASYASKKGVEWGIVPRTKFKVSMEDLLAAADA